MRSLILATVALGLLTGTASADTMKNCGAAWSAMSAGDKAKTTYSAYSKTCLAKGYTVPGAAASASAAPAGATGECKDKTYTMSKTHSGACSSHGGVDHWL
jgi:hypothetical protein